VIVRILIWSLFDSKTTIAELEESLRGLEPPSTRIWSDASERFGVIVYGDEVPEAVAGIRELIGEDPDTYEEFDVLDV
jgi:hypothetical protein